MRVLPKREQKLPDQGEQLQDPLLDGVDPIVINRLGEEGVLRIEQTVVTLARLTAVATSLNPFAEDKISAGPLDPAAKAQLRGAKQMLSEADSMPINRFVERDLQTLHSSPNSESRLVNYANNVQDITKGLIGQLIPARTAAEAELSRVAAEVATFGTTEANDLVLDEAAAQLEGHDEALGNLVETMPGPEATGQLSQALLIEGDLGNLYALVSAVRRNPVLGSQLSGMHYELKRKRDPSKIQAAWSQYTQVQHRAIVDAIESRPNEPLARWANDLQNKRVKTLELGHAFAGIHEHGFLVHGTLTANARWAVGIGSGRLMHMVVDARRQLNDLLAEANAPGLSDAEYTARLDELSTVDDYLRARLETAQNFIKTNEIKQAEVGQEVVRIFEQRSIRDLVAERVGREAVVVEANVETEASKNDPNLKNKLKDARDILNGGSHLSKEAKPLAHKLHGLGFDVAGKGWVDLSVAQTGILVGAAFGRLQSLVDIWRRAEADRTVPDLQLAQLGPEQQQQLKTVMYHNVDAELRGLYELLSVSANLSKLSTFLRGAQEQADKIFEDIKALFVAEQAEASNPAIDPAKVTAAAS